LNKNSTAA